MTFILLVTWFVAGQAPASYQIEFTDGSSCSNAVGQLQGEAIRLNTEHEAKRTAAAEAFQQAGGGAPLPVLGGPTYAVSAICVTRSTPD